METTAGLFDAERVRAEVVSSRLVHPSGGDAAALRSALDAMVESVREAVLPAVEPDLPFVWVG